MQPSFTRIPIWLKPSFPFLGAGLLMVVTWLIFGMWWEEGTDPVIISTIRDLFVEGNRPFLNTFGISFLISHLYKLLYALIPGFAWYDFFMLIFLFFATANLFILAQRFLVKLSWNSKTGIPALLVATLILLWLENVVLVQCTRLSILLSGTAALLILDCLSNGNALDRKGKMFIIFQNLLIFCAMMVRVESFYLVIGLMAPFSLFYLGLSKKKVIILTQVFGPSLAMGFVAFLILNNPTSAQEKQYLEFRPYQFTLWDFDQANAGVEITNPKDSIIYLAARKSFISDSKQVNLQFFHRINLNPLDKSPKYIANYFRNWEASAVTFKSAVLRFFPRYWPFFIFCLFLSILSGLYFFKIQKSMFLNWLIIQVGFWLVLVLLTIFMKMEDRLLLPMLVLMVLSNLCYWGKYHFHPVQIKGKIQFILVTFLLLSCFHLSSISTKATKRDQANEYMTYLKEGINTHYPFRILVTDLWAIDHLFIKLMDNSGIPSGPMNISIDNGVLFFYDDWKTYMDKLTGSHEVEDIFKYLIKNKSEVVFFSAPSRMKLITDYLHLVYGLELNVQIAPENLNQKFNKEFPQNDYGARLEFYLIR